MTVCYCLYFVLLLNFNRQPLTPLAYQTVSGHGKFSSETAIYLFPTASGDNQYPDTLELGAVVSPPAEFGCDDVPESLQIPLYAGVVCKPHQAGCVGKRNLRHRLIEHGDHALPCREVKLFLWVGDLQIKLLAEDLLSYGLFSDELS